MGERPGEVRWTLWTLAAVAFALAVFAFSLITDLRRARAGDWPSCDGVLLQRAVRPRQREKYVDYEMIVKYRYAVGGVEHTGDRVALTPLPYSAAKDAQRDLDDLYPAGRPVKVFYNPEDPSEAVLQPAAMSWTRSVAAGVFGSLAAVTVVGSRVLRTRRLLGDA